MPEFILLMGDTEINMTGEIKKAKSQKDLKKTVKKSLKKAIEKERKKNA